MDRSVAPPLGLTLSTCAMRVCARCVVWSLHHPHAAWSRYPTRHVFPRAARYTCPVHKCPIAGARACVRIRRRGSGAESPGDIERCSACGGHGHRVFRQQVATQPSDLPAGTGLTPRGSRLPHLHRDWARPCHICTRDWARPCHIWPRPSRFGAVRACGPRAVCLSHRSRRASISRSSLAHVRSHSRQPPSVGHHRLPRSHRVY